MTPVLRVEAYRYWGSSHRTTWKRVTTGARVRLAPSLTLQVNWLHQPELTPGQNSALDVGVTHAVRF